MNDENDRPWQYRGGRKKGATHFYLKIDKKVLASLFGVSIHTVSNWIWRKKIDPHSLEDIIDKYNNPIKLYKKRTKKDQ